MRELALFRLHQKGLNELRAIDYKGVKDKPPVIFTIFLLARALGFKVALEKDIVEKLRKEENEKIINAIKNVPGLEFINLLLKKGAESLDITDLFEVRFFCNFSELKSSPDGCAKKMIVKKTLDFIELESPKYDDVCNNHIFMVVNSYIDDVSRLDNETAKRINEQFFTPLLSEDNLPDCWRTLAAGLIFSILYHPEVIKRGSELVFSIIIKNPPSENIDDTEAFRSLESFIRRELSSNSNINCELAANPELIIPNICRFRSILESYEINKDLATKLSIIFTENILLPDGLSSDLCEIIERHGCTDMELVVEV